MLDAVLADVLSFAEYLAFDPDQPRDERGRFTNGGSSDAAAASGRASRTDTKEDHEAAASAHDKAAKFHAKEAGRRRDMADKAKTKKDKKRHLEAAEKHADAAAHHAEQREKHLDAKPTLERLGIKSDLDKGSKATVERAIHKGNYQKYLKDHPLDRIEEHEKSPEFAVNGVYARPKRADAKAYISLANKESILVTHERAAKKFKKLGMTPDIGSKEVFSISQLAKTSEGMRTRTMVHELGHHIHLDRSNPLSGEHMTAITKAYGERVNQNTKELKPGKLTVSVYARGDHKEWFAETHAAYVFHPKALLKLDPEAHALMRTIRKARGLE